MECFFMASLIKVITILSLSQSNVKKSFDGAPSKMLTTNPAAKLPKFSIEEKKQSKV